MADCASQGPRGTDRARIGGRDTYERRGQCRAASCGRLVPEDVSPVAHVVMKIMPSGSHVPMGLRNMSRPCRTKAATITRSSRATIAVNAIAVASGDHALLRPK